MSKRKILGEPLNEDCSISPLLISIIFHLVYRVPRKINFFFRKIDLKKYLDRNIYRYQSFKNRTKFLRYLTIN